MKTLQPLAILLAAAFAIVTTATPSRADFGNCGQPSSFGPSPLASDALAVLRAAVGTLVCKPCVCDATGEGKVTSSDALRVLRFAVGIGGDLSCAVCKSEQVIGIAGGTITSLDDAVTIVIPPGALSSDTTISIEGAPLSALPPSLRASATAWQLEPAGLALDAAATVNVRRNQAVLSGLGANLAMLVSAGEGGIEVLPDQTQTVDSNVTPTRVTAHATLERLSFIAIVPLKIGARVAGVPKTVITVNDGFLLTALVSQSPDEDVASVVSASYSDTNSGSFHPDGIETANVPLEEVTEGNFGHGLDYICSSQVSAFYTPQIKVVYDVTGAFDDAPSAVEHTTLMTTTVVCAP